MSKFFKALEQARQERALREQVAQRQADPAAVAPDPLKTERGELPSAAFSRPTGQLSMPLDIGRPTTEQFPPREPNWAPGSAVEDLGGVEEHLVSLLTPTSFEAEQYRALRHVIEQRHKDAELHIIAITSPSPGDGKTTTAINLAGALAQASQTRVLLLEADLRRPSIAKFLNLGGSSDHSLVEAILDSSLSLQDVVRMRPPFNLAVLPAGNPQAISYEMLRSTRLEVLLAEARQCYDYIIVDTPPLIPFPDCRLIRKWVDGFLIVVAAHKTPRKLIDEALMVIDPAKLISFVFNNDDHPVFGYYRHYYVYDDQPFNGSRMGRLSRALRRFTSAFGRRHVSPERGAR
jgi:capsular exopolysaccharide synthesis family protein